MTERDLLDERVLALLEKGSLRPLGLLPRASNYTFLAEVSDDSGDGSNPSSDKGPAAGPLALAVYKPQDGESPLWDFPDGTLCRREVAAYRLSRALGWPEVPPTVLREGPLGVGSVQLFVDADPNEHYFTLREVCLDAFMPVAAFDVVANNADRKGGHCLRGTDGTVWVVDHGVCFSSEPKLRTVIWEFAGEPVPAPLIQDVRRLAEELRSGPLRADMLDLLTAREVDATASRADALAATGRFPEPGTRRAYPWPPV